MDFSFLSQISQDSILAWFAEYAYEPTLVYAAIVCLMTASSFGLPVPEEVTLLSTGLVAYMATHPELYPPPFEGAVGVSPYIAAGVAFCAVFISDMLVFLVGKFFGRRLMGTRFFARIRAKDADGRVSTWTRRYGAWACGIFRFTPGLRFPGHMACGMVGVPIWKFVLVDGSAALVSVPTQVLVIAFYGDAILGQIKQFKVAILIGLVFVITFVLVRKWIRGRQRRRDSQAGVTTGVQP